MEMVDKKGGNCPPGKLMVFGGGQCANLGVANVRYIGVASICLANVSQSKSQKVATSAANIFYDV